MQPVRAPSVSFDVDHTYRHPHGEASFHARPGMVKIHLGAALGHWLADFASCNYLRRRTASCCPRSRTSIHADAHRTMYDRCKAAVGAGATLHRYRANDLQDLERLLRSAPAGVSKIICSDGVNLDAGSSR
jgi:hypothetical protein